MKKILSIFLAFTIMFSLSACADNSSQEDTSSNNTGSNVSADNNPNCLFIISFG